MPQIGIHALVGSSLKKYIPKKENMMWGILIGALLPDADNLAVAYATLTGGDREGLHRTFSHSILTMAAVVLVFYIISVIQNKQSTFYLGLGIGIGMLSHALIDFVLWFNGVEFFWPFFGEINFWEGFTPPSWWTGKLADSLEFGTMALFFFWLYSTAKKLNTDTEYLGKLKTWAWIETVLFVLFTILLFTSDKFSIVYGALYILTLFLTFFVLGKMKNTIEVMAGS